MGNRSTFAVKYLLALTAVVAVPVSLVVAQGPNLLWFRRLVQGVGSFLDVLIPVLIALAFVVFVWGLVLFIAHSGNEQAVVEGKQRMLWGVLALFVIVSIWGIIALLKNITDTGNPAPQSVRAPTVPKQVQ